MITLLSQRHLYNEDGLNVVLVHVAVTTSSELSDIPTFLQDKGLKAHEGSKAWDITNSVTYGFTADGNWHEWESEAVTIDSALSTTSENPVQNKVITNALGNKANVSSLTAMTQDEYDALVTKDEPIYFIYEQ